MTLRHFAGMSVAETAQLPGLSQRTLQRYRRFVKAWLKGRLDDPE